MATHNTISYLTARCCRGNGQLPERGLWHGRHPRLCVIPPAYFSCLFTEIMRMSCDTGRRWACVNSGPKMPYKALGVHLTFGKTLSSDSLVIPTFSSSLPPSQWQVGYRRHTTDGSPTSNTLIFPVFSGAFRPLLGFIFSSAPPGILSEKLPPCSKNVPSFFPCSKPRGTEQLESDLEGALWWE